MHIDCIKIIFMQSIFLWYNTIYNINGFIVVCKSTTVYCLKIRNTLSILREEFANSIFYCLAILFLNFFNRSVRY